MCGSLSECECVCVCECETIREGVCVYLCVKGESVYEIKERVRVCVCTCV